ncbi:FG-GAP repeat protein [Planctomycetes bacterium Poly30]|uniref:FG-GAP repeat protein n=1 Tax=Saltatorellus ferox TaxID=2528018 RepID=A0A518ETH1_9BACT|nr:FG-GAP repeat protein [Planctomycetes bacterium Poly30]
MEDVKDDGCRAWQPGRVRIGRAFRWLERQAAWTSLAVLVLLTSCGSDAPPNESGTSSAPPATREMAVQQQQNATRQNPRSSATSQASPEASIRVFPPQAPRLRPDFAEVAAQVNPAHPSAPWPGELLATSAESSLVVFLEAIRRGDAKLLGGMVTRDFRGQVLDAAGAPVAASGEELLTKLGAALRLGDPLMSNPGVLEVSVSEVEAPPLLEANASEDQAARLGRTIAHVRIGTRPETASETRAQVQATIEVVWRLGRRVRIAEVSLLHLRHDEIAPPFRDVTSSVVLIDEVRDGSLAKLLGHGALEAAGRTDRLVAVSDIYLALHGAAVGDLDSDGWEDIVVGRAGGQPNLCFMNRSGRLHEEGAARSLDALDDTGGMLIADMDGDGHRDVLFGRGQDVAISWNDGSGHFAERTALTTPSGTARVYSLSAADVDGDGDLDLYDTRYFRSGSYGAQAPTPYHDAMNGASNVFWRNLLVDGDAAKPRRFRDDTAAVGLDVENDRFSLSSVFDDFDGDGDLDLYVANDFGQNNLYAWNGTRFDVFSEASGLTDKAAGMGLSVADVDLDGQSDLVVSNMHSAAGMRITREEEFGLSLTPELRAEFTRHARGNTLYQGLGGGRYRDVTDMTGAAPGGWAWGARFVDWDRDGLMDIVVPNGFLTGRGGPDLQSFFWRRVVGTTPMSLDAPDESMDRYLAGWAVISHLSQFGRQHWNAHERTFSYANRGGFRFDDVTLATGLGFADDGRALVTADLDRDGRLDLVFRNRTSPILRVMQGVHVGGGWVSLTLIGDAPNVDAVGARVEIAADGVKRFARITAGDGVLGSSTKTAHFGLGAARSIDAVSVTWPDGSVEEFSASPGGESLLNGSWQIVKGTREPRLSSRGEPSFPPLDRAQPAPMESAAPGPPASRVPLLEEFPLGAWRLPFFAGPGKESAVARRIDESCGANGTFLLCWSSAVPDSVAALSDLRGAEAALETAGVRAHPLTLDSVREEARALERLSQAGLEGERSGGRVSRMDRAVLELITARTLAPYDDVPLPLGMLFDSEGDLECLYVGDWRPSEVLADAAALAARTDSTSVLPLTGGQWTGDPPRRLLEDVPDKLRTLGLVELADHLEARR